MINWREVPFVRLLIPFITGILICDYLDWKIPFGNYVLIIVGCVTTFFAFNRQSFTYRWIFGLVGFLCLILLGYQITYFENDLHKKESFVQYLDTEAQWFEGTIAEMPTSKKWIKFPLRLKGLTLPSGDYQNIKGTLLILLEPGTDSLVLSYGDKIGIYGKLQPIAAASNPHAFDYAQYLHYQNIHYQCFIKKGDWFFIKSNQGNVILAFAKKLSARFLNVLKKYLKGEDELAVASAILLGYKEDLSRETKAAYAETGSMHVLAVSGLHVGIIFLLLDFFLKKIRSRRLHWKITRLVVSIFTVWAFALLTGASASVLRAATMFSFLLIGKQLKRYTNPYNTLAASAFWLLLMNPFLLFQVGFQLSYLAVIGILYFQPKFYKLWIIDNSLADHLWQLTCVALGATLATLPISVFYFHQFPLLFWLAGLVVVDGAFLILALGILLIILDFTLPALSPYVGFCLEKTVWLINEIVYSVNKIPGGVIKGIWLDSFSAILLYVLLIALSVAIQYKEKAWLKISFVPLLIFLCISFVSKWQNFTNSSFTIYDTKGTLVDFFWGDKGWSFQSTQLTGQDIEYAAGANRWSKGIKACSTFNIEDTTSLAIPVLCRKSGLVLFASKFFLFVNETADLPDNPVKVDFLILHDNPDMPPELLFEKINCELVIMASNNKFWRMKKWAAYCESKNLKFHSTKLHGAFVAKFN